MTPTPEQTSNHLSRQAEQLNRALLSYSDRDWNYSRITLIAKLLASLDSPYALTIDILDLSTKQARADLKSLADEVRWGERHTSELGVLEIVSLRINKALLEATSDDYWQGRRPVTRIVKTEALVAQGVTTAFWYEIREVAGDDFDNR